MTSAPRGLFLRSVDRWVALAEQVAPPKSLEQQPLNYGRVLFYNILKFQRELDRRRRRGD
jgi:hypothetical protein